ncbi:hypothetical protein LI328DRAFT_93142 [Trichoderma asperelloides]|nr:hypothetical protein LI328DRAFT_93142 [Trichoderma asperelloides]
MDTQQWAYTDGRTPDQIQSFVPASSARVKDLDVRRPAFRTYSIGADKSTTSTNIHTAHATVAVVGPGHRDGQIRPAKPQPDPEVMGAKGRMACACSPPVSPASAHVTPCGRPMRPPYMPISWTDGQQSPRSKGPTRHAPVPYWTTPRCRPGSIKSHFAGSHVSPLTAADDVPVST